MPPRRRARRKVPVRGNRLTDREEEVEAVLLIVEGDREHIAEFLGITKNTLGNHLKSLYVKRGVHSIADLIRVVTSKHG